MPMEHENCPCMETCPLNRAMALIGGKWKMQILCSLYNNGPTRYNQLKKTLDGVSNTVLANALRELEGDGLRVLGPTEVFNPRAGVVSVDFTGLDNGEAAFRLEQESGVATRCGLHCAPLAHKTLGTFPQGAVRFSVGPFTTFEELDYVHGAVYDLLLEVGNQ